MNIKQNDPHCNDTRGWCKSRVNGRCTILKDSYPQGKLCPFYKKIENSENITTHEP